MAFSKFNMTFQFVIILVVMIVMWLGAFIHPVQMPVMQSGFIYQFFYNIFHGVPLLASIVAFLIIGVEGFWLNAILYNCRLVPQNTLLPMLLYVVAMSSQPDTQTITPMVITIAFSLCVLHLSLIQTEIPILGRRELFLVSALIAMGTMVSPLTICQLLLLIGIIFVYKLYSHQEISTCILGFLAPYVIWGLVLFLTDHWATTWPSIGRQFSEVSFRVGTAAWLPAFQNIFFLVIAVVSLLLCKGMRTRNLVVDDSNHILIVLLYLCALFSLLYDQVYPANEQAFAIPFAYTSSVFFYHLPNKSFWNAFFWVFIIVSVAATFFGTV